MHSRNRYNQARGNGIGGGGGSSGGYSGYGSGSGYGGGIGYGINSDPYIRAGGGGSGSYINAALPVLGAISRSSASNYNGQYLALSSRGGGGGGGGGGSFSGIGEMNQNAKSMDAEGGPRDNSTTNLIINYLPQSCTDRDLSSLFSAIGLLNTCKVMRDYKTGYSFGYGFVDYSSPEDAKRAIETYNGYQIGNKRLKVSYARPSSEDIKDTNLYVTNLPRTIDNESLSRMFNKHGQIVQINILRDKVSGQPRGIAFVRFNKRSEAQAAIAALNGKVPEGGTHALVVRLAEEHGKAKAAIYMMQHNAMAGGAGMGMGGGGSSIGAMPSSYYPYHQSSGEGGLTSHNSMVFRGGSYSSGYRKPHPYARNFM